MGDLFGDVYVAGHGWHGELGNGNAKTSSVYVKNIVKNTDLKNIKRISCGANHTICVDDDNNIIIFGNNREGQLGLGKNFGQLRSQPTVIPEIKSCGPISQG